MTNNTNATAATPFTLTNPTSIDVRETLGLTPERTDEIVALIHAGAKADGFGENIKGAAWNAVAGLPTEAERLFGAFAIGHGIGMNDDNSDFGTEDNDENPIAALFAALLGEDATNSDGGFPGSSLEDDAN